MDAFPTDARAGLDSDQDGYPDAFNGDATQLQNGNTIDKFPTDAAAALDSDDDGYPDAFLGGATQLANGNTLDRIPNDPGAYRDTDGDGYPNEFLGGLTALINGNTVDKFPDDAAAGLDSDDDGYPDEFVGDATQLNNGHTSTSSQRMPQRILIQMMMGTPMPYWSTQPKRPYCSDQVAIMTPGIMLTLMACQNRMSTPYPCGLTSRLARGPGHYSGSAMARTPMPSSLPMAKGMPSGLATVGMIFTASAGHRPCWKMESGTIVAQFHAEDIERNKLWIDGIAQELSQQRGTTTGQALATTFRIGSNGADTKTTFHGHIDEVAVWNNQDITTRSISPLQFWVWIGCIVSQYGHGLDNKLIAYYTMDEGSGSTLADASGNNRGHHHRSHMGDGRWHPYDGPLWGIDCG